MPVTRDASAELTAEDIIRRALRAFAQAIRAVTQSDGRVLMARATRPTGVLPKAPVVAPATLWQPVLVDPSDADGPAALNLQRALTHLEDHPSFDCFAATHVFADWFDSWGVTPFQIAVQMGDAQALEAEVTGTAHDLLLQVADGALRLIYDTDVVEAPQAQALVTAFTQALGQVGDAALSDA